MKILHVLDHSLPLFSGYSFRSQSILLGQVAIGFSPVVLTSPKQGSKRDEVEEFDGIRYYRTKVLPDHSVGRLPFVREARLVGRLAERIGEVVHQENIELIHSHSPSLNGLASLRVASKLKVPLLYEARAFWEDAAVNHGTFRERSLRYRVSRSVETFLFKRAAGVVTICDGMREDLIQRGIKPDRIQVVPNGVDLDFFQPMPSDPELVEKFALNGKLVFGFIGSFYKYEGLRFLLKTIPALIEKLPGTKLILVGGGYDEQILRETAKPYGDTVIFAGQVPHESIRNFYSILDVFVCPREQIRLTELVTPLKPLEAMGMGKTVLASDVGGHQELIQHDKTGLLFHAGSEDDFVKQAVRAAKDTKLRARLGEQARRYVKGHRSWPQIVSRYRAIYESLLRPNAQDGSTPRQIAASL
jgi:PEP-CTERM/exosortase A-associated glycosyltransferase